MQNKFPVARPARRMTGLGAETVENLAVHHDFSALYLRLSPDGGNIVMYQLTVKISIF